MQPKSEHSKTDPQSQEEALALMRKTSLAKLPVPSNSKSCPYCSRNCSLEELSFTANVLDFISISPNVTYYFKFLQFIILLLLFDFLFYGMIAHFWIIDNKTPFNCFMNKCLEGEDFREKYLSNKHRIFFTVNLAILILFKYIWLFYVRNINRQLDESEITPSDYTVHVNGLNRHLSSQELVEEIIRYFSKWDGEVRRVNLIYNIAPLLKLIQKYTKAKNRRNLLKEKIDIQEKKRAPKKALLKQYNKKLDKIEIQINDYEEQLRDFIGVKIKEKLQFIGQAYVTFSTQAQQRKIVNAHRLKFFQYKIRIGKYKVERAYEPHDIIWENLGQPFVKRLKARAMLLLALIILFVVSFAFILSMKLIQKGVKLSDIGAQYSMAFLIAVSLGFFQKLLMQIINKVTTKEKHITVTHHKIELGLKSVIAFLININLILVIVNLIVHKNNEKMIWGTKGLVTSSQLLLNFLVIGEFVLQIFDIIVTYKKYINQKTIKEDILQRKLAPCENREIREMLPFNISAHYNQIFKILIISFFFQSIFLYVLPMAIFNQVTTYICEKIKFTKFCKKPSDLNFEFEMKMLKNFEFCIFVMALGYFVFIKLISGSFGTYSIVLLSVTGFDYLVMDPKYIHKMLTQKEKLPELKYEEVYLQFPMDYNRQNPLTQQQGFKEWFEQTRLKNEQDESKNPIVKEHHIEVEQLQKPQKKIDFNVLETFFTYIINKESPAEIKKEEVDYEICNLDSLKAENQPEEQNDEERLDLYQLGKETKNIEKYFRKKKREQRKKIVIPFFAKKRRRNFPLKNTSTRIGQNDALDEDYLKLRKQITFGGFCLKNRKKSSFNLMDLESKKKEPLNMDSKNLEKIPEEKPKIKLKSQQKSQAPYKKFFTMQNIQKNRIESSKDSSENEGEDNSLEESSRDSKSLRSIQNRLNTLQSGSSIDLFHVDEEESKLTLFPQTNPTTQPPQSKQSNKSLQLIFLFHKIFKKWIIFRNIKINIF